MRSYERGDCLEKAVKSQKLSIGYSVISIPGSGEVDDVVCFGNNETNKIVWVPFNSKVSIDGEVYKVIEGEKYIGKRHYKTKETGWMSNKPPRTFEGGFDHSTKCLLDKNKNLQDLSAFMSREREVIYLGKAFFWVNQNP